MTEKEYLEMVKKIREYENYQHRKQMKKIQKQKPSIVDLDLSVRTYNILKSYGVLTIDQLLTKTISDFWKMRGFGKKCWDELEDLYERNGWELPTNI